MGPRGDTDSLPVCPSFLVPPPRGLLYTATEFETFWRRGHHSLGLKAKVSGGRGASGAGPSQGFLAGSGGRVSTQGGFRTRQEAPSLHGSGGASRPGLRDLPARRPHALRAGSSPPQPGPPPRWPRGGRCRCQRAAPGFHFYNPSGEGSHAMFLGWGVSSPGRTQSLLVIRTWVTFSNKTCSDRMYETNWEPELLYQ